MSAAILMLLSCSGGEDVVPTEDVKLDEQPEVLVLPDVSDIDMPQAYVDAMALVMTVNARTAFNSHSDSIDRFQTGCPDVYAGLPPDDQAMVDNVDEDATGLTWTDHCQTPDGGFFSGHGYWEGSYSVTGQAGTAEGITIEAERMLVGDGVVGSGTEDVFFEFDGEASDSMASTEADGYRRWTYSSLVDGTVTGNNPFPEGALAPFGWRTDLFFSMTGGNSNRLEARGNAYLFDGRMLGRFDSVALDIEVIDALGAGPDDCLLEPLGWIGLRDENAFWYDLVFLPRYDGDITAPPYLNDPLSECDGCGTLYIRGVEVGEVCTDFGFVFENAFEPPTIDEFVLSLRDLP